MTMDQVKGGQKDEAQLGLLTGTPSRPIAAAGMALVRRLFNLLLDEFLDRPTPPGPLWKPAKGSADRWT